MSTQVVGVSSAFLIEDQVIVSNGEGQAVAVEAAGHSVATLTFGVIESAEQQSIEVVVLRSADGENWDESPVLEFPQRFYAGTMAMTLDLRKYPGTAFLKARWMVNRWGRGTLTPQFRVYLFLRA
ncbi:MAG: hypothetical protein U5J83_08880 [Bryobacterales bacterium]|nr:hypothetical protein [Bryobacterales bacterium]